MGHGAWRTCTERSRSIGHSKKAEGRDAALPFPHSPLPTPQFPIIDTQVSDGYYQPIR